MNPVLDEEVERSAAVVPSENEPEQRDAGNYRGQAGPRPDLIAVEDVMAIMQAMREEQMDLLQGIADAVTQVQAEVSRLGKAVATVEGKTSECCDRLRDFTTLPSGPTGASADERDASQVQPSAAISMAASSFAGMAGPNQGSQTPTAAGDLPPSSTDAAKEAKRRAFEADRAKIQARIAAKNGGSSEQGQLQEPPQQQQQAPRFVHPVQTSASPFRNPVVEDPQVVKARRERQEAIKRENERLEKERRDAARREEERRRAEEEARAKRQREEERRRREEDEKRRAVEAEEARKKAEERRRAEAARKAKKRVIMSSLFDKDESGVKDGAGSLFGGLGSAVPANEPLFDDDTFPSSSIHASSTSSGDRSAQAVSFGSKGLFNPGDTSSLLSGAGVTGGFSPDRPAAKSTGLFSEGGVEWSAPPSRSEDIVGETEQQADHEDTAAGDAIFESIMASEFSSDKIDSNASTAGDSRAPGAYSDSGHASSTGGLFDGRSNEDMLDDDLFSSRTSSAVEKDRSSPPPRGSLFGDGTEAVVAEETDASMSSAPTGSIFDDVGSGSIAKSRSLFDDIADTSARGSLFGQTGTDFSIDDVTEVSSLSGGSGGMVRRGVATAAGIDATSSTVTEDIVERTDDGDDALASGARQNAQEDDGMVEVSL